MNTLSLRETSTPARFFWTKLRTNSKVSCFFVVFVLPSADFVLASLLIDEMYYTSITNIGNVLRERAKMADSETEADALIQAAILKYKDSLKIQPDHHKAFVYWAQCLLEFSQMLRERTDNKKKNNTAKKLLTAEEKMQQDEEARVKQVLLEAKSKCLESLKIKPNYHLAAFTMIDVCLYSGDSEEAQHWLSQLKKWTQFHHCYRYNRLSVRSSYSILCSSLS